MPEPVILRGAIAKQALVAARRQIETGEASPNPYCSHFEPGAHEAWKATFERYLHELTAAADTEGAC
jgi:hypothetical protein